MSYEENDNRSIKEKYDECMQRVPITFKFLGIAWYKYLFSFLVVRLVLYLLLGNTSGSKFAIITGLEIPKTHGKFGARMVHVGAFIYFILTCIMVYFGVCYYLASENRKRVHKIDKLKASIGPVDFPDFKREEIKGFSKERLDSFDIVEARKRAAAVDLGPGLDLNFGL